MVVEQLPIQGEHSSDLSPEQLAGMLKTMYRIRALEEMLDRLFAQGRVHGTMHLSVGQEGVAVGALSALRPSDYLISTHRGHGHAIAKGADPKLMLAEFLGKATGYCHGLGGSMHIAATDRGHLGANGIVAGGIAISVGVALAIQLRHADRVVLDIFGDGATNEGGFHEALNLASVWKLPVVFVCENNLYGMSTPIRRAARVEHLSIRAASYGMPGSTHDGNDAVEVYDAVKAAVERARSGGGPSLVECVTYRWKGHSKSDQNRYRTRDEIEQWKQRDPIARFHARLVSAGVLSAAQANVMQTHAEAEIADALAYADACPEPTLDDALSRVYA
jgi:TPP-dependent pyruvate/acetoin dehydrogenase alpha subunit